MRGRLLIHVAGWVFHWTALAAVAITAATTCVSSVHAAAITASLETADSAVRVEARDGQIALRSLRRRGSDWEWIRAGGSPIPLLDTAQLANQTVPLVWKLTGCRQERGRSADFTFLCKEPALEMHSIWTAVPGPGPVEHSLEIINRGAVPLLLPLQTSLRFTSSAPPGRGLEQWWVEKGAGHPTDHGAHREPVTAGYQHDLISTPYAGDSEPREGIPWTAVQDQEGKAGWYAGIEFSGRVKIALHGLPPREKNGVGVEAEMGLASDAAFRTRLQPGETWQAPIVFVGCYAGNVDDGANRLHHWVETALRPPANDTHYPLLVLNSWGSGMAVDEALASRMADDAASLGLEMLHIDAGWFRGVGDWRPNPAKFPHGLASLADYVHAKGLKFGLWVGWTQGGIDPDIEDRQAILNVFAPDRKEWFTRDYPPNWRPSDFTGADLCLSDPAADEWCLSLLDRLVSDYHLDMLEHDQRMIVDSCSQTTHPHTDSAPDIAYHAARGYYRVYDALRARHPGLLFEDCVNGGRTVDYGIVRRVHYISITDSYYPLANRRAFYDASYALPPAMCECYIQNEPVKTPAEFRTMLRSGMMGWCTIMCDTTRWTAEQHEIARRQFSLYKTRLRPLIQSGNLYHVSERPDGVRWDGMEYADPAGRAAALFAFRGTTPESSHTFLLRGLRPDARYRVSFEDGGAPPLERTGQQLMQDGLTVELQEPGSSQIVFFDQQR